MEKEYFRNRKFQHSELIEFHDPNEDIIVECLLIGIDFYQELFKLQPIDKEVYEEHQFWSRIEYCERPKPKLKIVKPCKQTN